MTEKYNVYLDDLRKTPKGYQLRAYTYEDIIEILTNMEGHIGTISLDNDLGAGLKEGHEVMDWIEEQYYTKGYKLPDKILVHSMNPIAKQKMERIIEKLYGDKNDKKSN